MKVILLIGIFGVLVSLALGGLTERLGKGLEKRQVKSNYTHPFGSFHEMSL